MSRPITPEELNRFFPGASTAAKKRIASEDREARAHKQILDRGWEAQMERDDRGRGRARAKNGTHTTDWYSSWSEVLESIYRVADETAQVGTVTKGLAQVSVKAEPVAPPVCNPGLSSHESTHPERVCPAEPKPNKSPALGKRAPRKSKSGKGGTRHADRVITIRFHIYALRPCDWDNYRIKYVQDWLTKLGIIPGDAWHQLQGEVKSFKVNTVEEERTEILIS